MIINIYLSACKITVIIVIVQLNLNFLDRFSKILNYQISCISVQWEPSCSMRSDRHYEGAFGNFAKAPKNKATVVIGYNTASPDIRFPDISKQYRCHILGFLNVPEFFLGHLDT